MTNQVVHPSPRAERFGMENHPRGPGDHKRSPLRHVGVTTTRFRLSHVLASVALVALVIAILSWQREVSRLSDEVASLKWAALSEHGIEKYSCGFHTETLVDNVDERIFLIHVESSDPCFLLIKRNSEETVVDSEFVPHIGVYATKVTVLVNRQSDSLLKVSIDADGSKTGWLEELNSNDALPEINEIAYAGGAGVTGNDVLHEIFHWNRKEVATIELGFPKNVSPAMGID